MTEYIGLFLPSHDADVLAVNAELAKGDEGEDLGLFYSDPVSFVNPAGQVVFWHVLVTRVQYDLRVEQHKLTTSFARAPAAWKNNGMPFHVFGRDIHLPNEEIEEIE